MVHEYYEDDESTIDPDVMEDPSLPLREISREGWNAPSVPENLVAEEYLKHPIPEVILSYTQTNYCETVEECKKEMLKLHKNSIKNGQYDIPYNFKFDTTAEMYSFVVGGDGTVFEGRGWNRRPEDHEKFSGLRDRSIEIAHFGERGNPPNFDQINGSWDLILKGIEKNYLTPLPKRNSHFYNLKW